MRLHLALVALCVTLQCCRGALTTGQYVVRNKGRDLNACAADLLGFNNRTCKSGTNTRPAGPGVGPSLRAATASNTWATFELTVIQELAGGAVEATLSTFVANGAPQPLCVGNLVAEKPSACADARAHIHPSAQAGADTPWLLTPVGDAFTIAYTGRAEGCATHLAAQLSCASAALGLAPADGSQVQEWVLERVGPASSPPPPPPPPLAGQPPSLAVSSVSAASAFATVTPPAGGCVPVAYELSHAPANSLSPPAVTAIPNGGRTLYLGNLEVDVTYAATAVGICADGTRTPPSAPARFTPFDNCKPADVEAACTACDNCFEAVSVAARSPEFNATCCPGTDAGGTNTQWKDCRTPAEFLPWTDTKTYYPVTTDCPQCAAPCEACMACGGVCFPGDALVSTPGGGAARMDALRVGDRVLAARADGSLFFDEIYMFGHKDAASASSFIQLATAGGAALRLTPDHHVFVTRAGARLEIPSSAAQVGDLVHVVGADGAATLEAVAAVSLVRARGLFNPYTLSGSIVVDGVAASCHSSWVLDSAFAALGVPLPAGYQAAFAPLRALYRLLGARRMAAVEFIIDAVAEAGNKNPAAVLAPAVASACALGAAAWVAAARKRMV